jgi:hypothetical protein
MMIVTAYARETSAFDDLLPLFKLHARIENVEEDALCVQYLRAAVSAFENATGRDVFPTTRTYSGSFTDGSLDHLKACPCPAVPGCGHGRMPGFDFVRGRVTSLAVTVDGDPAPADQYIVSRGAQPKAIGCRVTSSTLAACDVAIVSGFPTSADLPDDVRQFILDAAAALYEVRELANTQSVSEADFLPLYLVDAWRIPSVV